MLTIPNVDRKLRIDAIIKGFILGLIMTAFSIFSFYFITALTEKMDLIVAGPYIFSIILPIVVTVLFALNMRKKIGGFWTFRQAVTGIFMMFLISYAIVSIGRDLIFGKLIEPNMAQKTEVVMIKVRSQALKSSGASDKEINNQLVELRKEFDTQKKAGYYGCCSKLYHQYNYAVCFGYYFCGYI